MKNLVAVGLLALCSHARAAPSLADAAWLQGCWAVDGADAGSGEQWSRPAGGAMVGMSRTIRGGRMTELAYLQLRDSGGKLSYVTQLPGQKEVAFTALADGGERLVFENRAHDFPQRIIYRQTGPAKLHARIEGMLRGRPMAADYPMQRISCDER